MGDASSKRTLSNAFAMITTSANFVTPKIHVNQTRVRTRIAKSTAKIFRSLVHVPKDGAGNFATLGMILAAAHLASMVHAVQLVKTLSVIV